jgi:ABC-2 type transport system permease protein
MNNQPSKWVRADPGVPVFRSVNWGGLKTLYLKEVRRFFKVQLQTIWAPAITTLLFLVIFTVALGRSGRSVMGVPFADFLAPGLIIMGMIQAAFANSSFSLLMGSAMLAFLGLLTSIWAEKFDHAAAVSNFVVAPLSLLSGTFYSIESLSPAFRAVSHANPFFYIISGFRYGFLEVADSPVILGGLLLLAINLALGGLCYVLIRRGWKLKS